MTGGRVRLAVGVDWERAVAHGLRLRGWTVEPFGIGLLPPDARDRLRSASSPLRWLPDMLAWNDARDEFVTVDAKRSTHPTHTHAVEHASAFAASTFEAWARLREWFVFPDGCVVTPDVALRVGTPGEFRGNGSGTPFLIVPCTACMHVDDAFGRV